MNCDCCDLLLQSIGRAESLNGKLHRGKMFIDRDLWRKLQ